MDCSGEFYGQASDLLLRQFWPPQCSITMFVAIAMAQIVSAVPTSGGSAMRKGDLLLQR